MKLKVEVQGTWLTPIRFSHMHNRQAYYIYRCRCGVEKPIRKKNVTAKRGHTRSCGCWSKQQCASINGGHKYKKGSVPWNKGIKYTQENKPVTTNGKPAWNRGRIKHTYPNGRIVWIKVSEEPLGSKHKWSDF